jgi:hypothetical protein
LQMVGAALHSHDLRLLLLVSEIRGALALPNQ